MSDYTELVKALRYCVNARNCEKCAYRINNNSVKCRIKRVEDAAAAIEELQDEVFELEEELNDADIAADDNGRQVEKLQAEVDTLKRVDAKRCQECLYLGQPVGEQLLPKRGELMDLQARLGEAENSVERWKDMYLTKHEPKRGEWIPMTVSSGRDSWKCSVCGRRARGKIENIPYCHCGARMDIKEDANG